METLQVKAEKKQEEKKAMKSISGSVAVLDALLNENVKTIFGYPGGAIMPIYDALYDYNDRLEHILVVMSKVLFMQRRVLQDHQAR